MEQTIKEKIQKHDGPDNSSFLILQHTIVKHGWIGSKQSRKKIYQRNIKWFFKVQTCSNCKDWVKTRKYSAIQNHPTNFWGHWKSCQMVS